MKKIRLFMIKPLLLLSICLVLVSSCKKDEDEPNIFTDSRDSNVYKTITLGNQVWMAENLKYLPEVVGSATGSYAPPFMPYYYVYGYNGTNVADAISTENYNTYGVLYNWEAAKVACPDGWHLPSDAEWEELENYLADNGYNYDESTGGGRDKIAKSMASISGWKSSSETGSPGNTDYPEYRDKSGFTGLPGGSLHFNGTFDFIGDSGNWWSATEGAQYAWYRYMFTFRAHLGRSNFNKGLGFSVRCVRD